MPLTFAHSQSRRRESANEPLRAGFSRPRTPLRRNELRLLLVTFEMDADSQVLAWQTALAAELAPHCERLVVLTHRIGRVELPNNVAVHLFALAPQRAPWRWIGGRWALNAQVWRVCRSERITTSLVHMNYQWTYRLYPSFRLLGIPTLLWYAHGSIPRDLRLALMAASRVVTSTPEGFRLLSPKVKVIGQGIDTEAFNVPASNSRLADILYVGRISARKQIHVMVEVLGRLLRLRPEVPFRLIIAGAPITAADAEYEDRLRGTITALRLEESVILRGQLSKSEIAREYEDSFCHLNLSKTGSLDKTLVESFSAGCPVVTSNEAAKELLNRRYARLVSADDPDVVARALLEVYESPPSRAERFELRRSVVGVHDVAGYVARIITELNSMSSRRSAA